MTITVDSQDKRQVIDITEQLERQLPGGAGVASLFIKHTTAALTTADLDPGTDQDLLNALIGMLPERQWRHPHDPAHAPSHLLSSIIGPGVVVPFAAHRLQLGTWQRVILVELDGPRPRQIELHCIGT